MKSHLIPRGMAATLKLGTTLMLGTTLTLCAAPGVLAQHEHHSNTFSKIGHAVEYTVRKDAKNVSRVTHRAIGHNSVVRRNHGRRHYNRVVTPDGHLGPVHHNF